MVVTRQGERESYFYIIYRGEASVLATDAQGREMHIATLGRGNHFGEMSLLYQAPRNATIRAGERLELLALDELRFRQLLASLPKVAEVRWDGKKRQMRQRSYLTGNPVCSR